MNPNMQRGFQICISVPLITHFTQYKTHEVVSKPIRRCKNFANITGNHLCWSLFLRKLQAIQLFEMRLQHRCLFSSEICQIFKNTFFNRTSLMAASVKMCAKKLLISWQSLSMPKNNRQMERLLRNPVDWNLSVRNKLKLTCLPCTNLQRSFSEAATQRCSDVKVL